VSRKARTHGRRAFSFVFALGIYLGLLAGTHFYLAARFALDTALPLPARNAVLFGFGAAATLLFAYPIAERVLRPRWGRLLAWPLYVWMGTLFYLLLGTWASDVALWAADIEGVQAARMRGGIVGVGALLLAIVGMFGGLGTPAVRRVELTLPRWPAALDGYRIVQISDIHIGPLLRRGFARRVTERCNALDADLIAVTGDLVDGSVGQLAEEVAPFGQLRARDGVFFVNGNHEHYSGAHRWNDLLTNLGLRVLVNEHVTVRRDGAAFHLAGIEDRAARQVGGGAGPDLKAALAGIDEDAPVVLLAHHPAEFRRAVLQNVDLQLSGHTHGGQIWPFGQLVRAQTRWIGGRYVHGASQLYVSRGTGFWGPPMRIGSPAEITELVVKRETPKTR
jgi:predicted MPP superfamily phosphohydrolase